ncbi:MAG: xanthine dehydrogenase family protein molybdopterin-binding subunit [Thermoplasmata archaeon]|nr:xanthine dehydrogenase family protein molybdopterin-binding subunit [Thermoplasmata archaeon]
MIRTDLPAKVSGETLFGMDLGEPGMLWGALVLSPVAHGRLRGLGFAEARAMPGVEAVVGPEETDRLLAGHTGDPERPVFPRDVVAYRGQPLAAVAARTLAQARAAARAVRCEIDPLPIVPDIESVFPEWPGSGAGEHPSVIAHVRAAHGDLEAEFRAAEFVQSETYRTNGVAQVALEPHACLARVEAGRWLVRTSTQSPFSAREDISSILGVAEESVVVEGTWVGGGFGGKAGASVEPYALLLAASTGRPVKLALNYAEEFLIGRSTLPSVVHLESAVRGGRVTGRRARLLLDTGASLPGRDFATGYAIGFLLGPYRVDAFEVEGYAVRTNKPPFGPHRAPFAPQCAFMADSHMDGVARRLGVDPVAFRLVHAWAPGDRTPLGQVVGPFGMIECLQKAGALLATWRKEIPYGGGFGLGVGCGFWSTNAQAGGEAVVRLTPTELVIEQGEREIGSGSVVRGLPAVLERVLHVPAEVVRVSYSDTASAPFDSGVFGSRTVAGLGGAVEKAARGLSAELARRLGSTGVAHLSVDGGGLFATATGSRRPVEELLTPQEIGAGGLRVAGKHYGATGAIDDARVSAGSFYAYTDFTAAAHLALVHVDRETGAVKVLRYAAFHDAGVVIDPPTFRAQVEGGVVMGLGSSLTEETLWSPEGRLLNPSLLDYRIPTLGEVPPIEVHAVPGHLGAGPFGAKGLGEPPIIPVPAAVANAVADATGVRVYEMPLSAERVARALKLLPEGGEER